MRRCHGLGSTVESDANLPGARVRTPDARCAPTGRQSLPAGAPGEEIDARIHQIRKSANQSWSNLRKAVQSLQGKPHEPFGTRNVEATARSVVRRIGRKAGLDLVALEPRLISKR